MLESIIQVVGNILLPYLLLSLLVVLFVEMAAQVLRLRARVLRHCINNMLDEPGHGDITARIYSHPLVTSLSPLGRQPPYIPAHIFAVTVLDVIEQQQSSQQALRGHKLETALKTFERHENNVRVVRAWFDDVMNQASSIYRSYILRIMLLVTAAIVFTLNFDALAISRYVTYRAAAEKLAVAIVAAPSEASANERQAEASVPSKASGVSPNESSPYVQRRMAKQEEFSEMLHLINAEFPLGWTQRERLFAPFKLIGLFASIFAVVLTAPLLFDALNRFIPVRFDTKPSERAAAKPKIRGAA